MRTPNTYQAIFPFAFTVSVKAKVHISLAVSSPAHIPFTSVCINAPFHYVGTSVFCSHFSHIPRTLPCNWLFIISLLLTAAKWSPADLTLFWFSACLSAPHMWNKMQTLNYKSQHTRVLGKTVRQCILYCQELLIMTCRIKLSGQRHWIKKKEKCKPSIEV